MDLYAEFCTLPPMWLRCSHLSGNQITLILEQPTRRRSTAGRGVDNFTASAWPCSAWGLHCHPRLPEDAVSSYLTISPLPTVAGGLFSVALSVVSPEFYANWIGRPRCYRGTLSCGVRTFLSDTKYRSDCSIHFGIYLLLTMIVYRL